VGHGRLGAQLPPYLAADRVCGIPHCLAVVLKRMFLSHGLLVKRARVAALGSHPDSDAAFSIRWAHSPQLSSSLWTSSLP